MNFKSFLLTSLTIAILTSCGEATTSSFLSSNSETSLSETISSSSVISSTSSNSEEEIVSVYRDVAYGSFERNTMDIMYLNNQKVKKIVLLIHGGSWVAGDKRDMELFSETLIAQGYAYVSMNYRLMFTPATFQDMLVDIQTAILYLRLQASFYGFSIDSMAIGGVSAGAHLSLLFSYQFNSTIPIAFVFALVPPVDFTDPSFLEMPGAQFQLTQMNSLTGTNIASREEIVLNGFPSAWLESSPIHYVSGAKPTLFAYAGLDELVPSTNVPRLLSELDRFEKPYEAIFFENSGHSLQGDPEQFILFNERLIDSLASYLYPTL